MNQYDNSGPGVRKPSDQKHGNTQVSSNWRAAFLLRERLHGRSWCWVVKDGVESSI